MFEKKKTEDFFCASMSFHYFIHVWRGDNGDDDNAHQGRVHVDAKMPLFMNAQVHLYLDEINLNVSVCKL